ncbi:MAG: 2-hydroxyacid dehydrogenase [Gammaproteobacteria bacterium]
MRGVFLDFDTLSPADLDCGMLESTLPEWRMFGDTQPEQVATRLAGASVVVTNKVRLDGFTLRQAKSLRLVCLAATGFDNVDVDAATELQLPVCNVRNYATQAVAQHTFGLILALSNRLLDYHRAVRAGRWQNARHFCLLDFPIRELAGLTLGIIGYGHIGRAVAQLGQAFGMTIVIAQRPGGSVQPDRQSLPSLLSQADVLTLHCPLTAHTRGLIGAPELALMKPHALLINTARGGLVNEAALARALRRQAIGGAGIDVLSREPPSERNPLLATDLKGLIITPHVAWGSRAARQRLLDGIAENIRGFLLGSPPNVVNL